MQKLIRILITSAGTAAAINIIKGLKLQNEIPVKIYASDINPYAPGLFLADQSVISPNFNSSDYINFLFNYCRENKIDVLFPGYSKELLIIADHQQQLNALGVKILISSRQEIELCNDKLKASQYMHANQILIPHTSIIPEEKKLPLIAKPIQGSGSHGVILIKNLEELKHHLMLNPINYIYQHFIEGQEYTVDVLCDQTGNMLFCGPRLRQEVKAGLAVKSITVENKKLEEVTKKCCELFKIKGVCNIQFIEKENQFYFIEINPRFAAASILTIRAGANLPLAVLKILLGYPLNNLNLRHEKQKIMTRYWEEIII